VNEDKDSPESEANEQSSEAGVVCTACLETNPPHIDYCARCGAPLNSLVAFNPFDQTLVEGFAYRRAVDGPPSRIILIGIWLLFAPTILFLPLAFSTRDLGNDTSDGVGLLFERVYFAAYFVMAVIILYRTTANYISKRKKHEPGSASQAETMQLQ